MCVCLCVCVHYILDVNHILRDRTFSNSAAVITVKQYVGLFLV